MESSEVALSKLQTRDLLEWLRLQVSGTCITGNGVPKPRRISEIKSTVCSDVCSILLIECQLIIEGRLWNFPPNGIIQTPCLLLLEAPENTVEAFR